jgi:hypothetical protein
MTPLAHQLARNISATPPGENADFVSAARKALAGAAFFEVTEASPLLMEVHAALVKDLETFRRLIFHPAPKIWIEWCGGPWADFFDANRVAMSAQDDYDLDLWIGRDDGIYRYPDSFMKDLRKKCLSDKHADQITPDDRWLGEFLQCTSTVLAIINSPKIVEQRAHAPHKGLVRQLRASKYPEITPTEPWHEIKLRITKPEYIDDGEPHADVITGRRALHFCRRHLRVCHSGVLTYVTSH